jgi:hypothetical protein
MSLRDKFAASADAQRRYVPADHDGAAVEVRVECLAFRPKPSGKMLGFCDLAFTCGPVEMIFHNCIAFSSDTDDWVNLPSRRDDYQPYVKFANAELKDAFQREALAAIERYQPEGA